MENTLDARGLACPQPVILTKKALEELKEGSLVVVVDNDAARGNVCSLASSKSCGTEVEEKEGAYYITITRRENLCEIFSTEKATVIVFGSNVLGSNEELGKVLMKSYIYTLSEGEDLPRSMIFLNSGVILTTQGSEVLDELKGLESRGVEILSCGTCLEFFELKEKLAVGSISNMYTITEKMAEADKVFTLG
ncbi:sulfurtransferase-like selenium metabolism protein YedF [Candidatus Contubernalis alkaliaceticus]|uniref:sulfurtransferase-like selenium metabolism protein YedF n=1 Tax=Candidatus Contubernalis alkaliaceticus TaxID=338645 RepID=UPI001F4BECE0|nr:sulfurtransferase-like selenium metabolism protein YedF [Candidatus Contubernalis alkalaceticus]UNC90837.1 sulfurtransferase-like selenium metabolism protein YedF [Candidatus Contubernalis alkalaceticus]